MVATLVSLFEQVRDVAGAIKTLDEYASSASQTVGNYIGVAELSQQKGDEEYLKILKESANFKLKHKFYKEAAATFEQVIKLRPADLEALAGVVIAYSHVDPKIAQK
jgi:signal recognition particle subunit SRP72